MKTINRMDFMSNIVKMCHPENARTQRTLCAGSLVDKENNVFPILPAGTSISDILLEL